MELLIRPVQHTDAEAICAIYNYYITHSAVTFEEITLTPEDIKQRIISITQSYPWLVAEAEGKIIGYAYAGQWKLRSAYRHTAEVTIYLDNNQFGKGYGKQLFQALIETLRPNFHVLMGVITLPNAASVKLHESFGFEKAGHFSEVGRKFEQWLDVGYWQKTL